MGHSTQIVYYGMHAIHSMDPYWTSVYASGEVRIMRVLQPETVDPFHFRRMRSVELALRADPPDVVVAQDLGAPAYSALRLRHLGLAFPETMFVVFCHGTRRWVTEMSRKLRVTNLYDLLSVSTLEHAALELADVVVSPSAYLIEWMRAQGWRLPERTLVIPYVTRSGATGQPPPALRATADGAQPVERLAFFGRLEQKKGVKAFVDGLNKLDPKLIEGLELEFLGKATPAWPPERVDALLSPTAKRAFRRVSFRTALDQPEVIARLSRRGTLAVIPSLGDNSPNTVYECLEHGIPFVASEGGGIGELIALDDRERVSRADPGGCGGGAETCALAGRAAASGSSRLRRRLLARAMGRGPGDAAACVHALWRAPAPGRHRRAPRVAGGAPALPDRARRTELPRVGRDRRSRGRAPGRTHRRSRPGAAGRSLETRLRRGRQRGWIAGRRGGLGRLPGRGGRTRARASGDARPRPGRLGRRRRHLRAVPDREGPVPIEHFFAGDPGGLGVVGNGYGTVALLRRSLLDDPTSPWPTDDPDWLLLARLRGSGARIVSVPLPLVTQTRQPGTLERNPPGALLVAEQYERVLPDELRSLARLAAGLAADVRRPTPAFTPRLARRAVHVLREQGPLELTRLTLQRLSGARR